MNYKLAKASEKILLSKTGTKLVKNLNEIAAKDTVLKFYIGAYLHYNEECVNIKDDYKNLLIEKEAFLNEIKNKKNGVNKYHDINNEIILATEKKSRNNIAKKRLKDVVSKIKIENNLSWNKIFNEMKISYSNGYNFFKKNDYSKISLQRLHGATVVLKNKYE